MDLPFSPLRRPHDLAVHLHSLFLPHVAHPYAGISLSPWLCKNAHALQSASSPLSVQPRIGFGWFGLRQTFSSLPDGAEDSRTPNFASSLCSVRSPPLPVRYSSHAPDFHGFTTQFSSTDMRMVWLHSLLMVWLVGLALWMFTHRSGNYKFSPSMVCVRFYPAASIV